MKRSTLGWMLSMVALSCGGAAPAAGELLESSGIANHSPHLHVGFLLDGEVEQTWGTFLLADEIRRVLGGYRNGDILPKQ